LLRNMESDSIRRTLTPGLKSDCRSLFEIMVVNWDGTVMSCALERYVVGDLKESSIDEIWNSKGMVELRRDYYKRDSIISAPDARVGITIRLTLLTLR